MENSEVKVGQRWAWRCEKKKGIVVEVSSVEEIDGMLYARLTPVVIPEGKRTRVSLKWHKHVPFDLDLVEEATPESSIKESAS